MGKAEEYRGRAEACECDAAKISFAPDREALLEIARRWREMANHAEARENRKRDD